jgi:DNA-binding CsgD family transcriptional regulator/sugar-specific transcriptional regulator TrmB
VTAWHDRPVLQVLGLTSVEQEVYERLVRGPAMTLAELDTDSGRATSYLARLCELGLVSQLPGEPPRWSATPPGAALEVLLSDRSRALAEAARHVADLDARFYRAAARRSPPDLAEVIYGREAIVRRSTEIQSSVRYEIRSCDAPPYPEHNPAEVNTIEIDQLRRGIRYRILYDRRALDIPGRLADLEAGIAAGEEARVTDVPLKMTLIDHSTAILPLRHPADVESRLIVYDAVLVDALSALFEMYWERALPLRPSDARPQLPAGGPSPAEAHLLPLLVAGLTDQEIAAQLHLSDRTVRSRVHAMMARLDAATRFQAGFQAVARGWLATDELPAKRGSGDAAG